MTTVYQFSYRAHPNMEHPLVAGILAACDDTGILDCRDYLASSHDEETALNHPRFEECVEAGLEILDQYQSIAVGCHLRWMATPVSNEIARRLRTGRVQPLFKQMETKCNDVVHLDYEVGLIPNEEEEE